MDFEQIEREQHTVEMNLHFFRMLVFKEVLESGEAQRLATHSKSFISLVVIDWEQSLENHLFEKDSERVAQRTLLAQSLK